MTNHIELAKAETRLMTEYLAPPSERPNVNDCIWIEALDTAIPPPKQSIRRLQEIVEKYGLANVTTAVGTVPEKIGVYVKSDSLERAVNPLWTYLETDRRTHRRIHDWTDHMRDDRRIT